MARGSVTSRSSKDKVWVGSNAYTTGSATFPTTAPQQPGTYVYTCTGDQGCSLSATLVVSAAPATTPGAGGSGALPSTGSGGISQTTGIALGLLVVGLGLVIVAQIRRRTNPSLA